MAYQAYPPDASAHETAPSFPESYVSESGLNPQEHHGASQPYYSERHDGTAYQPGQNELQYGTYGEQRYRQGDHVGYTDAQPVSAMPNYQHNYVTQGTNGPDYYQTQVAQGPEYQNNGPVGTTASNGMTNDPNYQAYGNGLADNDGVVKTSRRISKKWQRRLYWIVPLVILAIALVILFEVYKNDFERWVQPLTNWLRARIAWSWIIPVAVLFVLSFPPLFGHEIVQLIVGLTYPFGVAVGIVCAGAILGEAACFLLFKYAGTNYTNRKRAQSVKWEATARVCQQAGFWGVMVIRYSIVPPHLANPLFATTGMSFFVYMASVVLSLPKTIVFVALGNPNNNHKSSIKVGKVIAFGVLAIVTLFASWWIRKRINAATKEIEAERMGQINGQGPGPMVKENGFKNQRNTQFA